MLFEEKKTIDTFQINIPNTTIHHITTNICDFFYFQMFSGSIIGHSDVLVSLRIFLVWTSLKILLSQSSNSLTIIKRSLISGHPGFLVRDGQTICQHSVYTNNHSSTEENSFNTHLFWPQHPGLSMTHTHLHVLNT